MEQAGDTTQATGKGKSGSGKGKGKARTRSNSGSRSKPPSKPGTPQKGTPSGTHKTVTLPKAPKALAPMSTSVADMMAPPALPLVATKSVQPNSLAVASMDTKASDDKSETLEVEAVQETLNTVAAYATPMEEDNVIRWIHGCCECYA